MAIHSTPAGAETERWVRLRRVLNAPPARTFRAWSDPEELARWYPERVEGGLAVGAKTMLVWPERRVWWEVVAATERRFTFRQPSADDESLVTTVTVAVEPFGYGSRIELEDGPFTLDRPGVLDAWAAAVEGWTDALALLHAHLDFSVDLRRRA